MNETSETWRAYRAQLREKKKSWRECPHCKAKYGSGTKVPINNVCRKCGWHSGPSRTSKRRVFWGVVAADLAESGEDPRSGDDRRKKP